MTKKDRRARLAAELHAKKEDLTGWEEVSVKTTRSPSLVLSIRMKPEEVDELQHRAAAEGLSVSELVRRAVGRYFQQADRAGAFVEITGGWGVFQRDVSYTRAEAKIEEIVESERLLTVSA